MENKQVDETNLQEVIELVDRKPRRSSLLITLNSELTDEDGLSSDKELWSTQYVLAKGDLVKDIEVGDKVDINLSALTKLRRLTNDTDQIISEIDIKTIELGDYIVGQVDERVVESIFIK